MSRKLLLLLLITLVTSVGYAQVLDNGSLEGNIGTNTPINWESCFTTSTVDVLPGLWNITKPAQDGSTYINMVCRADTFPDGRPYPNADTCEELTQVLNNTLISGRCYRVEMYLSFEPNFLFEEFRNPINLRVSGGRTTCSRDEEIIVYEGIAHEEWRRYVSYFTPEEDLNAIWLEGEFNLDRFHFGHILVDNISIEAVDSPESREITVCQGETETLTAFLAQDAQSFNWSTGAATPEIEVAEAGVYTVDMAIGECTVRETFEVIFQDNPVLNLTEDFLICPQEEIILDASTPDATYAWQDGSTSPLFTATAAGTYGLTLTVGDCITQHNVTITEDDCAAVLEMPNAFTPNADSKNDFFTPIRSENIISMQTVIYNRWGRNVYDTSNLNIEWNGSLPSGEPAPASTYFWRINYTDLTGKRVSQKGTVTLMR